MTITLSPGGDWVYPHAVTGYESPTTIAFRKVFLERLPVVALKVVTSLMDIAARHLEALSDQERYAELWEAWKYDLEDGLKKHEAIVAEIRDWQAIWHLTDTWIGPAAINELHAMAVNFDRYERSQRYVAFSAGAVGESRIQQAAIAGREGGISVWGWQTTLPGARMRPFTEKDLTPRLKPDLLPWDLDLVPGTVYRAMAERMGADLVMVDAWMKEIQKKAKAEGMKPATRKASHAHFDALIRWQCLEWPWECVAEVADPDCDRRTLKRLVNETRNSIGLESREAKRGGAKKHNGKTCPCSSLVRARDLARANQ